MHDQLPEAIARYLDARRVGDVETALALYTDDATLVDVDVVHAGRDAIRVVLARPITERNLTFVTTGVARVGDEEWDVGQEIDGDLPAGPYALTYHFTLRGDRIARLQIEFA